MPLMGKIRQEAQDSLIEAKLIKGEEGPEKIKKLVDKLVKKASQQDKTELVRMSNYEIFLTITYLLNSDKFTYDETVGYCEEIKKTVNAWTYEKDARKLNDLQEKTNEDGSFADWSCANYMTELGISSIFASYQMKIVYLAMYHFLKLKNDLLVVGSKMKALPITQRIKWMKGVYKNSLFSKIVDFAQKVVEGYVEDHDFRQSVSGKRIEATEALLEKIEDGSIEEMTEIPNEWHQYLDPRVLEPLYSFLHDNIVRKKICLDVERESILSKRNRSSLTTYLYDNNLDPYSLPDLAEYESIPNIVPKIEFLKNLGIPVNNILLIHKDFLKNCTGDLLEKLTFFIGSNVLSKVTLREHLKTISEDYQRIISNYEILKDIIDFNNIFYKDTILFKDIKEIKMILSVLKEYKLSLNNYIFLLCNYEFLSLYDLIIEKEIPEDLFISICKTEDPLSTIKRILIYISIGEAYSTPTNFLKKDVTSESKFICSDESLDEYLPNVVEDNGLNILSGETITTILDNDFVKQLDNEYRVDNTYIIGGTIISRPKFLRNFESIQGNPSYLIASLVSSSILDAKEYHDLTSELKHNKTKK